MTGTMSEASGQQQRRRPANWRFWLPIAVPVLATVLIVVFVVVRLYLWPGLGASAESGGVEYRSEPKTAEEKLARDFIIGITEDADKKRVKFICWGPHKSNFMKQLVVRVHYEGPFCWPSDERWGKWSCEFTVHRHPADNSLFVVPNPYYDYDPRTTP